MFGSTILDVAIGIIFVYALVSIICSAIREGIETFLKTRSAYLEYGIRELLHDKSATGIAKSFYRHPLISVLYSGEYRQPSRDCLPGTLARGGHLPSYIPARNFALALMDMAARGPDTDLISSDPAAPVLSIASVRTNILNLRNEALQRVLLTAMDSAQGDLNGTIANLEAWFDSAMDRVSGWYKRSTQFILFLIGLLIAVGLNVNTITIADYLYRDDAVRTALVARAEGAAADTAPGSLTFQEAVGELNSLSLPMGWSSGWGAPKLGAEPGAEGIWNDWAAPVLGWLLTAFAATLGAPFWFDLLNKVMVIRSTVKPHEKSPEEASEDRQLASTRALEAEPAPSSGAVIGLSPRPPQIIPSPRDDESDVDGCDVAFDDETPDEELPAAEGGVA